MITDATQIQKITNGFDFLRQGDSDFNELFFYHSSFVRLNQGDAICQEGMQCSHLALVLSGTARVFKLGETGREITLYRIVRGQSCILTASCIISASPFPAFAVCESNLEAVVIPTADVKRWLNDSALWRSYLFGLISDRLSDVITIVEEVAFKRVDRRIAGFLLTRADAINGAQVKATHQEIASDLGTSREVVSRILKDLEGQACIAISRGAIQILDVQSLRKKAEDI